MLLQARVRAIDPSGVVIALLPYSDASFNTGPANAFHPVTLALGNLSRSKFRKPRNQLRVAHLPVLGKKTLKLGDEA